MPLPIEEFRNQQGIEATNRALMAELAMKFEEAQEHYKEASQLLQRAIPRISQKSEERRRVEWQFKFVEERRRLLAAFKDGTGYFPEPLPSFFTIQREGAHNTPGLRSLTAVITAFYDPFYLLTFHRSNWDLDDHSQNQHHSHRVSKPSLPRLSTASSSPPLSPR